jgi:hypothetical protein
VEDYRVNNVWSCTSSLPYVFVMCTGTTKCYIYQIVLTLSLYILTCYIYDFLSLHSFIRKLKYVCFLFITEHCRFKVSVCFWTVCDLVGLVDCKIRNVYKKRRKLTAYCYFDDHQQAVQIYCYQFVTVLTM